VHFLLTLLFCLCRWTVSRFSVSLVQFQTARPPLLKHDRMDRGHTVLQPITAIKSSAVACLCSKRSNDDFHKAITVYCSSGSSNCGLRWSGSSLGCRAGGCCQSASKAVMASATTAGLSGVRLVGVLSTNYDFIAARRTGRVRTVARRNFHVDHAYAAALFSDAPFSTRSLLCTASSAFKCLISLYKRIHPNFLKMILPSRDSFVMSEHSPPWAFAWSVCAMMLTVFKTRHQKLSACWSLLRWYAAGIQ